MTKYIAVIMFCFFSSGCNNLVLLDLQITNDGVKSKIKSASLYIQVNDCKNTSVLDRELQNSLINIQKKRCLVTGDDGLKAEYKVPLSITDNWLNTTSVSIISNKNTFLTIKIPYKTIKLFKDKVNHHLASYPLVNEYPLININITLKGHKSLTLDAHAVYFDGNAIANGTVTFDEGRSTRLTLSKIAVEQLFNTGQVTILSK